MLNTRAATIVAHSIALLLSASAIPLAAQLPDFRMISSIPECATCTITLTPGATLLLPNDSLSFGYASRIVRLVDGRMLAWDLNETRVPVLFDSSGKFLRNLARLGRGPGEMGHVENIYVGHGDSIWVHDADPSTWHVLAPDTRYMRRVPLEPEPYDVLFATGSANRIVATDGVYSSARAAYPLHIVNTAGDPVRSFGPAATPEQKRANESALLRLLAMNRGAPTFWARIPSSFSLEEYDFAGNLVARVRHQMDGWYKDASAAQPGSGEFTGKALGGIIPSRDPGMLWFVYYMRRPDFMIPRGDLDLGSLAGRYDVVIEAFDTRSYKVVASQRFEKLAMREISNAPDMISVTRKLNENFYTHQAFTLTLVRR